MTVAKPPPSDGCIGVACNDQSLNSPTTKAWSACTAGSNSRVTCTRPCPPGLLFMAGPYPDPLLSHHEGQRALVVGGVGLALGGVDVNHQCRWCPGCRAQRAQLHCLS